jgi:adenylosuccinate synthase
LLDDTGEAMRRRGVEFGTTTGRPRRCGWLDAVLLRESAWLNGATQLAVTKLDILDQFETLKVATAYEIKGEVCEAPPGDLRLLDVAVPVYEDLSGWQQPIGDCRNWEDLPAAAQAYLQRVSELAAAPIGIVSVGPAREQTIMV